MGYLVDDGTLIWMQRPNYNQLIFVFITKDECLATKEFNVQGICINIPHVFNLSFDIFDGRYNDVDVLFEDWIPYVADPIYEFDMPSDA